MRRAGRGEDEGWAFGVKSKSFAVLGLGKMDGRLGWLV